MLLVAGIFRSGIWLENVKKINSQILRDILKIHHNKLGYKEFSNTVSCPAAVKYIDGFMPGAAVPELLSNRQHEKHRMGEYRVSGRRPGEWA